MWQTNSKNKLLMGAWVPVYEPDDGSVENFEKNTWADWCGSAFGTAFGAFPSEADGPRTAVMFSDRLFSEEELADTAVSVLEEVLMLPLRNFADMGFAVIPPVANWPVRRIINRSRSCLGRCVIR